jgi:diguanylate cyclase (GGDEF)-like protein
MRLAWSLRHGRRLDVQVEVDMPADDVHFRSTDDALAVPRRRGRLSRRLAPPPANDPALLEWARAVAAAADRRVTELESRIAQLESQVTTDELTGLLNRRGFLEAFERANAAARRDGPRGVVVLCDLDGFKKVNDLLGHAHGDYMLREMGTLLRRNTRKMDAVARFGGDEFALLLIGAAPTNAKRKCQGIGRALNTIGLRASFGVAEFDGQVDEDGVLHAADMAMYEEKRANASERRALAGD